MMTQQQQPSPQNSVLPDEISAAFAQSYGVSIGGLIFQKLQLEKQMQALQAHCNEIEAALNAAKQENSELIANYIQLENQTNELKKELEIRPTLEQMADLEDEIDNLIADGPTVAHTAAREAAKAGK